MSDTTSTPTVPQEVILQGCTPEPLMNYLKALGILRLVAEDHEHGDPNARGFWRDDVFVLRSRLDEKALEEFFLEHYRPTPIMSPWNGDGGFLAETGTSVDTIKAIETGQNARLDKIRSVIAAIRGIPLLSEFAKYRDRKKKLDNKKKNKSITDAEKKELAEVTARVKAIKQEIVSGLRNDLPEETLHWLDACMVIATDAFFAAPSLGSGGVDGRMEFGANFLSNVRSVLEHRATRGWLGLALTSKRGAQLLETSIGQFAPGRIGGPNGTQGFEGASMLNPWDFVFMLEGAVLLAGAATRRFGADTAARAVFPFTCRAIGVGDGSVVSEDAAVARGELWLPMWDRPTGIEEIRSLIGEGRAEVSGRTACDAVDFARAVTSFGVDRGLTEFSRFGFHRRNGLAFLATSVGRLRVGEREHVDLLREIDPWLDSFRSACSGDNVPARFASALRAIDASIFDFCRYGGPSHFTDILISLGRAEREMALTPGKIGQSKTKVAPIAGLSFDWVCAAAGMNNASEGTPFKAAQLDAEFQIALALAGVRAADGELDKVGPLRTNLEPVLTWHDRAEARAKAKWAEKDRAVVWNAADLSTNLAAVLARRVMDGERNGCEHLPLAPTRDTLAASPAAIAAFLRGELDDHRISDLLWGGPPRRGGPRRRQLDDHRISDLLWGLMLVNPPSESDQRGKFVGQGSGIPLAEQITWLPPIYCLLKLLFLPRDLVMSHTQGKVFWKLSPHAQSGTHRIRPEPGILALLRAGRTGEAATIAMRRLRSSGLTPLPHRRSGGPSRDHVWSEVRMSPREGQRLAAALLIPIAPNAVNALVHRATRGDDADTPGNPSAGADLANHDPAATAASPSVEN